MHPRVTRPQHRPHRRRQSPSRRRQDPSRPHPTRQQQQQEGRHHQRQTLQPDGHSRQGISRVAKSARQPVVQARKGKSLLNRVVIFFEERLLIFG